MACAFVVCVKINNDELFLMLSCQARIQLLAKGVVVIMTCRTRHRHQKRSTLADDVRG